jgi:hypothetical protein
MTGNDPLALAADLAVLARALEVRGIYNGGKLLRAALDALLTRLALTRAPEDDVSVLAGIHGLRERLSAAGLPADLVATLPSITEAIRTGGILPLAAAPPSRVCRACGELLLGDPPATCPTCEAPSTVLREHLPIWFLEPVTPDEVLGQLAAGIAWVGDAVGGRDDEALARPPRPGEWSARDTLEHLLSTERLLAGRIDRLLSEDQPDLAALTVSAASPALDEATEATGEPASELVRQFAATREANRARLAGISSEEWQRSGRHPEWGTVTILSQAAYFARHQASHTAQLAAAADGRVPGQRVAAR